MASVYFANYVRDGIPGAKSVSTRVLDDLGRKVYQSPEDHLVEIDGDTRLNAVALPGAGVAGVLYNGSKVPVAGVLYSRTREGIERLVELLHLPDPLEIRRIKYSPVRRRLSRVS